MGEQLNKWLKLRKEPPLREEVDLNIRIASTLLENRFKIIAEKYDITPSQYNVLVILKGVYPDGHPRCAIADRMIERSPDCTRLIDRLEQRGLVWRDRSGKDRRMSITRITKKGINLLEDLKPKVENEHKNTTKNLSDAECRDLSRLLEKYYAPMT